MFFLIKKLGSEKLGKEIKDYHNILKMRRLFGEKFKKVVLLEGLKQEKIGIRTGII